MSKKSRKRARKLKHRVSNIEEPPRFLDASEMAVLNDRAQVLIDRDREQLKLEKTFGKVQEGAQEELEDLLKVGNVLREKRAADGLRDSLFDRSSTKELYNLAKSLKEKTYAPVIGGNEVKLNSLYSDQLGIGREGDDPLEKVGGRERFFHSFHARFLVRSLDMLERIVSAPAQEAVSHGWEYTLEVFEAGKEIPIEKKQEVLRKVRNRLDDLLIKKKLKKLVRDSRLYTLGALWYPVIRENAASLDANGKKLADPIKCDSVEEIECINVLEPEQFTYVSQTIDPAAKNFGEIEFMFLKGAYIDPSRYLFFVDHFDPYLMRGLSVLDRILTGVKGLNIAQWSVVILLLKYASTFVFYEKGKQLGINRAQINDVLTHIKETMTTKSVTSLPDAVKIDQLAVSFSGFKEATEFLYEYLAAVSGVPISILRSGGKGSSEGDKDTRIYFGRVHLEEQLEKVEPCLQMILDFVKYEQKNKYEIRKYMKEELKLEPTDYSFGATFNPLVQLNAKEKEELEMLMSQRYSVDVNQLGALTPAEVRELKYPDKQKIDDAYMKKYEEKILFSEGMGGEEGNRAKSSKYGGQKEDGDGASAPKKARSGKDAGGGRKPTKTNPTSKKTTDTQKRR